jgi:DNA-binding NtrC family response regulator
MKILLVEDDPGIRKALTDVLLRFDSSLEIEGVGNGDDALKRYLEGTYQLVITDYAHPGMFGNELIDLIVAKHPSQPIILQTGNYGKHIEAIAQKHRTIPFLEKPYPLQRLQDLVRECAKSGILGQN